jgi:hypothetical protein
MLARFPVAADGHDTAEPEQHKRMESVFVGKSRKIYAAQKRQHVEIKGLATSFAADKVGIK